MATCNRCNKIYSNIHYILQSHPVSGPAQYKPALFKGQLYLHNQRPSLLWVLGCEFHLYHVTVFKEMVILEQEGALGRSKS